MDNTRLAYRFIERMSNTIKLLAMEIGQELATESKLFCSSIILNPLCFAMLLGRIDIEQILRRGWMDLAFWPSNRLCI
jgi:hypothetical protein